MYACTVDNKDGLTLNAPYPFCHSNRMPFSPIHRDELSLQLLHNLGQSQCSRQGDKQMNMVGSPASRQNLEPEIVRNANQVSVKPLL